VQGESPNRQVGVLSLLPTDAEQRAPQQSPNRQVGVLSLLPTEPSSPTLPEPASRSYLSAVLLEPITELHWAYQLHYYICFRTRWRRNTFDQPTRAASLARSLTEVCSNHDYHLLQHKVYPDHLRCLLSPKPDQTISTVINKLKSNISRGLCSEFGIQAPLWATGYLARSVGHVRIQEVKHYLAHQADHHGYSRRVNPPVFRYRSGNPAALGAAHAAFDLRYHLVLATRYRRGVFGSSLGRALVDYWLKVAHKKGFALDEATVLPDHVHLLVRVAPKMSIEECALSLMNNSEHWMGKNSPGAGDKVWQRSAYAGTRGKVTTAMVKAFLARVEGWNGL